jgi:hypothetical protein
MSTPELLTWEAGPHLLTLVSLRGPWKLAMQRWGGSTVPPGFDMNANSRCPLQTKPSSAATPWHDFFFSSLFYYTENYTREQTLGST